KDLLSKTKPLEGVQKALLVLFELAKSKEPLSPSELSTRTGINRTTIYRILKTFIEPNIVESTKTQNYQIGWGIWKFTQSHQQQNPIINIASPIIDDLWITTQESVQLNLLFGNEVMCVSCM